MTYDAVPKDLTVNELQVMELLGEPEAGTSKEMAFWCPKCNPSHHKPKLFVNRETFQFHCFVCGFGGYGVDQLAWKLGKRSKYKTKRHDGDLVKAIDRILNPESGMMSTEAILPEGLIHIATGDVFDVDPAIEYLEKRDISMDEIANWRLMYGLGFDPERNMRGRIVFPSFDSEGDLTYYTGRATWERPENAEFYMPYKDASNISKASFIFNEVDLDWNYPIVIVEGVFDAIRIPNAVPTLGKSIQPTWKLFYEIVDRDQPVIIMRDADAAEEQRETAILFRRYGVSDVKTVMLPEDSDPGSLSRSELATYLRKAEVFLENHELTLLERLGYAKESTTQNSRLGTP